MTDDGAPTRPAPGQDPMALMRAGSIGRTNDMVDRIAVMEIVAALTPDILVSPLSMKGRLFPHQMGACTKALTSPRRGLLLADEVGLGKTIEAGLILKELAARGRARSMLILTPASLTTQWRDELRQLLGIELTIWGETTTDSILDDPHPRLICSLDTAKAPSHIEAIRKVRWDVLVVDEAHRLKERTTRNFELVRSLSRGYLLLLSATPIQNRLTELFNEVTLIDEELLGTENAFRRNFFKDKRGISVKNINDLKRRVAPVTIRNRRDELKEITFVKRFGKTISFDLSPEEEALYDEVTSFVRREYRSAVTRKRGARGFLLILFQRMLTSTPYAIAAALTRRRATIERTLAKADAAAAAAAAGPPVNGMDLEYTDMYNELSGWMESERAELELELDEVVRLEAIARKVRTSTKTERLMELVGTLEPDQKALVFTEFRATQDHVMRTLAAKGIPAVSFNGSMSREDKDAAVARFTGDARIMVSTESGGEGRNLQFCNVLVNFDLPWNPMKVEQRIGRLHRIGQTRNVTIFNFSTNGTIEEYIIYLLEKKIRLFEDVIGDLDFIIGEVCGGDGFERTIMRIFTEAEREDEMGRKARRAKALAVLPGGIEAIGKRIDEARSIAKEGDDRTGQALDRLGLATPLDVPACLARLEGFQADVRAFLIGWLGRKGAEVVPMGDGSLEATVPRSLAVGTELPHVVRFTFRGQNAPADGVAHIMMTLGEPVLGRIIASCVASGRTAASRLDGIETPAMLFSFSTRFPLSAWGKRVEHVVISIKSNHVMQLGWPDIRDRMRGDVETDTGTRKTIGRCLPGAYERAIAEVRARSKEEFARILGAGLRVDIGERRAIVLELHKDREQDMVDEEKGLEDTKFRLLERMNGCKDKETKERCNHELEKLNRRLQAMKEANGAKRAAMSEEFKRRMAEFDRALEGDMEVALISVCILVP